MTASTPGFDRNASHNADSYVCEGEGTASTPAAPSFDAGYESMFLAAVRSLAEISKALGIPDDDAMCANGNELILERIASLTDTGECLSCVGGKCVTGPQCVTLGRSDSIAAPSFAGTQPEAAPAAWRWMRLSNGAVGFHEQDPAEFGVDITAPDYRWTPLYTAAELQALRDQVAALSAALTKTMQALEHIVRRLRMDIDDGGRPDQWSMEDLVRKANPAIDAARAALEAK